MDSEFPIFIADMPAYIYWPSLLLTGASLLTTLWIFLCALSFRPMHGRIAWRVGHIFMAVGAAALILAPLLSHMHLTLGEMFLTTGLAVLLISQRLAARRRARALARERRWG